MKQIMLEIRNKFEEAVHAKENELGHELTAKEVMEIYDRVSNDIYLEKLSQLMDRN